MASNVVSIAVQANSTQLQTAFDQGATAGEKFKAKMGLVAKAVVAALAFKAAQAISDFVGDSIKAFSDLNESLNAVEVTFGKNADGIKKLGEQAAQNLGLSNAEFNSFAVSISAFAHDIAGDSGDVVGVVDEMTTRITDFASVMNLDVTDAQEKFQSGLAGQSRPLREFGIDVSAARVEAFAMANGIGTAGEALTESEKVLARYGTIMEQTEKVQGDFANTAEDYANAQRIANAEMENAKARAGEALIPFAQLTTQLKGAGAQAIGIFSTQILALTGSMEEVDSAIQQFEIHTGQSADSAESALTIMKEYGGSFDELIPRLDLSREELEKLRDADEDFLKSLGFTEEQIKDLARTVKGELASSLTDGEQRTRDFYNAQLDLGDATGDTTDEIKSQADTLRAQTDPLFGAMKAANDLEEAQRNLNDAIVEYGEDSQEAHDAARDVASANADLIGVLEQLKEDGIDPTGEAARGMLEGMGIPPGVIDSLFREFDRIESNFESRVLKLNVAVPNLNSQFTDSGLRWKKGGVNVFQHGGIVTDPMLGMIGEGGDDEAVIPLNNQGIKILGAALREAMGGGGGINITVNAGAGANGHTIGEQIVEEIVRARRRGVAV